MCDGSATWNPTPDNICGTGDFIGQVVDIPNACFFGTNVGQYCDGTFQQPFGQTNGSTEWTLLGSGGNCGVCSGCSGFEQGIGNGVCGFGNLSCSWAGARQSCRRDAFNGDPTACCRRSVAANGNLFCFDSDSKQNTCDPIHRGFGQPACTGVMATYCSNDIEEPYQDKWTGTPATKDCLRFVQENAGDVDFYGPVIEETVFKLLS